MMQQPNKLTDAEIDRRRDEAVRRALNTPPTPHKPIGKKNRSPKKRTTGKGRARVGKSKK